MAFKFSPHYKFMEAAKAALEDAASEIDLTWKIQKLAGLLHKKWAAGAFLVPVVGSEPAGYENANDKIITRTLAVICRPSELGLTSGMELEMQRIERVEDIFRNATVRNCPASVLALNSLSPDPGWRYAITRIEPGDRFLASAFQAGVDVCATVLATEFIIHRSTAFDFTALGA